MSKTPAMTATPHPTDDELTTTYKVDGDQLIESDSKKVVYRAKVNGPDVALDGGDDPSISTVAVKQIDANTVEETYKKGTDVAVVSRMTVRKDGKTMDISNTWNNPTALVMKMVALKQ